MKPRGRRILAASAAGALLLGGAWTAHALRPLVRVDHAAKVYPRRATDLTANVVATRAPAARDVAWRLNGGAWRAAAEGGGRLLPRELAVEIPPAELAPGGNVLEIRARAPLRPADLVRVELAYDPAPVALPFVADWRDHPLEVGAGRWERVEVEGGWRVRPVPGEEGFDRMLVVCGAFPAGRRVETTMVYRGERGEVDHGFGVLVLWGGRPEEDGYPGPRRGWLFGLTWWYSKYGGAGSEFSTKRGGESPRWVHTYRDVPLEPDSRHHLVAEAWPEQDAEGRHARWVQRSKWWREGEPEPAHWMEVTDVEGAPLPAGEYAVALLAHWTQVEFGPVSVSPLEDVAR